MAKKKTVTSKKTAVSKKKAPTAKKKTPVSAKAATTAPIKQVGSGTHEKSIPLLPIDLMEGIKTLVEQMIEEFKNISDNNLTNLQRRRKIGSGIRNYGFIDKVSDLATANPQYANFFNIDDLKNCIRNIEICRELVILLQSLVRMISNTMLIYSDDAYSMALIYYNMVKEMSRRGDPVAMEIFRALQPFFKRPKRTSGEPTVKELERDLHSLIHGKKDGKIVVENEAPKATARVRKIVDDTYKSKAVAKETAQIDAEE